MKRSVLLCALVVIGAPLICSCAMVGGGPAFYSDIMGNNYYQAGATTEGGGKVVTGQACWKSYVGIYAGGDASVAQALADAGVQNTSVLKNIVVDHKIYAIGPFYMEYCTVVTATVQGGGGMAEPAPVAEPEPTADEGSEDDSGF